MRRDAPQQQQTEMAGTSDPGGSLSISAPAGRGRYHARIALDHSIIRLAAIEAGSRLAVMPRPGDGCIILEARADGQVKLPEAQGKARPRHTLKAAPSTFGLQQVQVKREPILVEPMREAVRLIVPQNLLVPAPVLAKGRAPVERNLLGEASALPKLMPWEIENKPRKPRSALDWTEEIDPIQAILQESSRTSQKLTPARIGDIVEFLRAEGRDIRIAGPRLFMMDGEAVNWASVVEAANLLRAEAGDPIFVLLFE